MHQPLTFRVPGRAVARLGTSIGYRLDDPGEPDAVALRLSDGQYQVYVRRDGRPVRLPWAFALQRQGSNYLLVRTDDPATTSHAA
jgi:hypothetical protein